MTLEVIGAGFGRTGTMSLKLALEQIGFGPCYHMDQVIMQPQRIEHWERVIRGRPLDWQTVFEGYRAAVDWPACTYWMQLMHAYPRAKIVLSVRDADEWYDSVIKTIVQAGKGLLMADNAVMRRSGDMLDELIWDGTFDGQVENRAHAKAVFTAHNERVRRLAPPDRLLEYQSSEGWEPLCAFLGVAVPATPYPRVNSKEDYVARLKGAGLVRDE